MVFDISALESLKKNPKNKTSEKLPSWVTDGTDVTRKLYESTQRAFVEIKRRLESADDLAIKERRLVGRVIAKDADVDHSNLRVDRQPRLMDFINELNQELDRIWLKYKSVKSDSGAKLTKKELEKENVYLKRELELARRANQSDALMVVLESELLMERKDLARALAKSKEQIISLEEMLANARRLNQEMFIEVSAG